MCWKFDPDFYCRLIFLRIHTTCILCTLKPVAEFTFFCCFFFKWVSWFWLCFFYMHLKHSGRWFTHAGAQSKAKRETDFKCNCKLSLFYNVCALFILLLGICLSHTVLSPDMAFQTYSCPQVELSIFFPWRTKNVDTSSWRLWPFLVLSAPEWGKREGKGKRWVQTFLVVKGRNLQLSNKSLRLDPLRHWLQLTTWRTLYEHELYAVVYSLILPLYQQQTKL